MRRTLLPAALAVLLLSACGAGDPAAGGGRLSVVATTTQVADFARVVGGDRVSVHQMLKPNVDPHDYEPTPADIAALGAARVVVKNGVGLERWLEPTIAAAGFRGGTADASAGVAVRGGDDPHIWHDPGNAKVMAANIERAFAAADPGGAAGYERNLASYLAQLDRLDADIRAKIQKLPAADRKVVTDHDAFGYYIDRYGLQFVGAVIPGFDTSAELSARDVDDIVAKIHETGAKAVFAESSLPPRTAETIARRAGVKVVAGEDSLYGDTLGAEGSDGDTYLTMEEHNTDVIVQALGG